jgi:predicted PurR-regulated permease PerM
METKLSNNMILWFFLFLFLVSIVLMAWLFMPFFSIIVMAAVITTVFNPVYRFLVKPTKIRPVFAALVTCILIFFLLFIPLLFFSGVLSKEAYDLYLTGREIVSSGHVKHLFEQSGLLDKVNAVLSNIDMELTAEDLNKSISELGKFIGLLLFDQAKALTANVLNFVINFFFMLMVVFFLLMDGRKLIEFVIDISPLPREEDEKLIQKFKDMTGAILMGNGLGGFIQGTAGGIAFAMFGLNSPFLWGVVMAFLAFLPIIGIGVVFLPAALYLFLKGRIAAALFFVVFYAVLSGGIEYLFKPKIVGDRVKMHTLLVFLAIIGGLKLFGILGIIYGPLIVTGFLTLADIYTSNYQKIVEPEKFSQ